MTTYSHTGAGSSHRATRRRRHVPLEILLAVAVTAAVIASLIY